MTGSIAVNERKKGFRHRSESPFIPENLKTNHDVPSFGGCATTQDGQETARLSDHITNYIGDIGGPGIPDPEQATMDDSDYWKAHGWKVKHVYSVHRNGESLLADSPCHKDFEAEIFKRTYGDKPLFTPAPTENT